MATGGGNERDWTLQLQSVCITEYEERRGEIYFRPAVRLVHVPVPISRLNPHAPVFYPRGWTAPSGTEVHSSSLQPQNTNAEDREKVDAIRDVQNAENDGQKKDGDMELHNADEEQIQKGDMFREVDEDDDEDTKNRETMKIEQNNDEKEREKINMVEEVQNMDGNEWDERDQVREIQNIDGTVGEKREVIMEEEKRGDEDIVPHREDKRKKKSKIGCFSWLRCFSFRKTK